MDNLTKQIEEIEALTAIYGSEFQIEDGMNRSYSIKIVNGCNSNLYVKLYVKFTESYPSESPPTFEISAPHLPHETKLHLSNQLEDVYLSNIGQNVIFQWIERIREELYNYSPNETDIKEENHVTKTPKAPIDNNIIENFKCPSITHGEVIFDRKSSFQGHTAIVFSVDQVKLVLNKLKENKKILQATHNMYAYRIYNESTKYFLHDCDDDGEAQAGRRLMHLLEIMDVKNLIVVVSRWYGGIHLGPDRFRHINNAARQVLTAANVIKNIENK
ncbi:protein IMPACT-like [Phymastichus coffea]|uniref:protein IMPACT-like n=1 Tax=Phymastichus coffea TaxID=108790 RepID=UPI00273B92B8|nr:protein IMPACT-like [Phymastichus coffea]